MRFCWIILLEKIMFKIYIIIAIVLTSSLAFNIWRVRNLKEDLAKVELELQTTKSSFALQKQELVKLQTADTLHRRELDNYKRKIAKLSESKIRQKKPNKLVDIINKATACRTENFGKSGGSCINGKWVESK